MRNDTGCLWARQGVRWVSALACLSVCASLASAQPIMVQVDQEASFIELSLDVSGFTDTDSSPIAGTITVDPVDPGFPNDLLFYGYNLALQEDLSLTLGGGFLGSLVVNFLDLTVVDDFQGQVFAAPVLNDQFTLVDTPSLLGGTVSYNASGLFCVTLGSFDLPCQDSQNLTDQGTVLLTLAGDVQVVNNIVTLSATIDATTPLDPANPEIGTITVTGLIVGSAELSTPPECPGDLNEDGQVDTVDLGLLLGSFGGAGVGDINGDGLVDTTDLGLLLGAFGQLCE